MWLPMGGLSRIYVSWDFFFLSALPWFYLSLFFSFRSLFSYQMLLHKVPAKLFDAACRDAATLCDQRGEININFVAEKKRWTPVLPAEAADRRPVRSLIAFLKGPPSFLADVKIFAVCHAGINLAHVYPRWAPRDYRRECIVPLAGHRRVIYGKEYVAPGATTWNIAPRGAIRSL